MWRSAPAHEPVTPPRAVRTAPNIVLRSLGGLPVGVAMSRLPPRVADPQDRVLRRLVLGGLSGYGPPEPEEGTFARLQRLGVVPAVVDKEVIQAIKDRRIEVVGGVESLDATGVDLSGGARVEPDAIIAATGYRCGLEPLVGHLGVLGERGVPVTVGGGEAAPGLRFLGFVPVPGQVRHVGIEAKRAARAIAHQRGSSRPAAARTAR